MGCNNIRRPHSAKKRADYFSSQTILQLMPMMVLNKEESKYMLHFLSTFIKYYLAWHYNLIDKNPGPLSILYHIKALETKEVLDSNAEFLFNQHCG